MHKKLIRDAAVMTLLGAALAAAPLSLRRQARPEVKPQSVEAAADSAVVTPSTDKYGIPAGGNVVYGRVAPGHTLSELLSRYGLSGEDIHRLMEKADSIFDVRKVRSGQTYAVYFPAHNEYIAAQDSLPQYFVYEIDDTSYVVFDLRDDGRITLGEKPTEWRRRTVKGTVNSSLWAAMQERDTSPLLAVTLSNIFGWSIDFFGLQKEDEFRVIYAEEYVEGQSTDRFRVLAASFRHADSTYYALPFKQGDEELYYNEQGNSLEGAFLKAPLDFYRISSRFSNSRFHPVLKRYRAHHGVDYAAPAGTPVYAVGNGRVIAKAYQAGGAGYYLKIRHNSVYVTTYMHLSRYAKGIHVGSEVKQKEVIGYVGATGIATGPHLDFRVHENGKPINPLLIKSQPKRPISAENRARFAVVRDSLLQELADIR